jgi:hypothetical protein
MQLLTSLLTTDVGLMSAGVILFMVLMGVYIYVKLRKLMQEKPGKTGWN